MNDLGGEVEIIIYSDTINKYEALLNERDLILVDVEIKNETNQGCRIIGRRIRSLNQFISEKNCNVLLHAENNQFLSEIVPLLDDLEVGSSNILLISSIDQKIDEIKIRENIKLSSKLIANLY